MELQVKLEVFDGPLDLLLHLIEKNKVDIFDIPIVLITEQYLDYVRKMDTKDMDVMSEFLVMAATLVKIKSKMLLPAEEEEQEEYVSTTPPWKESVMQKQVDKIDPIRSEFGKIEKEEINIEDHMIFLEEYAMLHKKFSFRKVLENGSGKSYVIVTFLGILEMMKTGKFTIEQDKLFDDIIITYNPGKEQEEEQ